jgi:hypothetical protein
MTERMLVACSGGTVGGIPWGLPAAIVAVAPSYKAEHYQEGGFDDLFSVGV